MAHSNRTYYSNVLHVAKLGGINAELMIRNLTLAKC